MAHSGKILSLDVGEKRIGVALADATVKIAVVYDTLVVDGGELGQIAQIIEKEGVGTIVIGLPRNQSGDTTKQTEIVRQFGDDVATLGVPVIYQDESLTSVHAEGLLKKQNKPYTKAQVDSLAACLILQDYLEDPHGRI
ncbi:Holliday junction resolvase RuvX [Candidatus Saccharibacteria bacterium]|nr:Holliday junction resolvase RuvX [Candidatus Saccharibacteria bacterium]